MPATECPPENELFRFARGQLDDAASHSLSSHLDACPSCRRAAAEAASEEPLTPLLTPGTVIGRYELDAVLGAGAMGAVFKAIDRTLHRSVALKLLHAAGDEQARARLEREAQAMARLSHPNVVTVYELGAWSGGSYLAMEFVDGPTLDEWRVGRPASEVRRALLEAGQGLAAAHRAGVVHRDFKPRNLVVGLFDRLRVTDFGLSRPLPSVEGGLEAASLLKTQAGALVGTPAYMAPEQLDGKPADERSDQFAWCVVFVEALTGARPFDAPTREGLRAAMKGAPVLGAGLTSRERAVLRRGLAEDPAARFPSLDALLEELGRSSWQRLAWVGGGLALVLGLAAAGALRLGAGSAAPPERLEVGKGKLLSASWQCITRVAIGDPQVADVKTLGEGELVLLGEGPGETTLLVWDCDGHRHSHTVVVPP